MSREREEIEYLYGLRRFGMRLDLSIMREFIKLAGNPHEGMNFVHVAGTNGKGTVASFVYHILGQRYRVGLYTSPHISRFTERIVVDGEEIDEDYVVDFVRRYRGVIDSLASEMRHPTFFEVTTTMALKYFREMNVDFAVLEVGLGGRLDATNIVTPRVSSITTVDYDHMHILGKSIEKIAREKAGIIKRGVPVVVGERKKKARRVIEKVASTRGAPYHNVNDECSYDDFDMTIDGMRFTLSTPVREYRIRTRMLGMHQVLNAMVAVRIAELLQENFRITTRDIERGIENTLWRGRFEIKSRDPLLIFDGAHNPAGARVLADTLRRLNLRNTTLLFSMLADKDVDSFLKKFRGVVKKVIVSEIDYRRKMPVEELEERARRHFDEVIAIRDPCEALRKAMEEDVVLATGSIYFLGDLEKCLGSSR